MNNPTLTKTCSSCGIQKPLAAFLEMGGPEGTTYGTICASCRKANRDKPRNKEHDDSTTSHTGLKIDAKAKVQDDTDKKERLVRTEEEYYEEREKEFEEDKLQTKKSQVNIKAQKQHRESFLNRRPLVETNKTPPVIPANAPSEIARQEEKADFTNPFIDTQIAGKIKYAASPTHQQFMKRLPQSAPVRQAAEQAQKGAAQKIENEKAHIKKAQEQKRDNASTEYIEQKWSPSSRRR
ncbi:MAG: hypothetical protein H0W64_12385 [Gammaproteobacteria bacterium]|nr:hypothetical protein [Gammaproteobacteria bacterium]